MSIFKWLRNLFRREEAEETNNEKICSVCSSPVMECDCRAEWTVVLLEPGDKKVNVIKEIRRATGYGLKEAKEIVDLSSAHPIFVKSEMVHSDAFAFIASLALAGAKAVMTEKDYDGFMCEYLESEIDDEPEPHPTTIGELIQRQMKGS